MPIDLMLQVFEQHREKPAIIWREKPYTYGWLLERVSGWAEQFAQAGVATGTVAVIEGDFSPAALSLFLALIKHACIVVPLTGSLASKKGEFVEIAQGQIAFVVDQDDQFQVNRLPYTADHRFYEQLRQANHPGLVLFSSGSTGAYKAAVHDCVPLLAKFRVRRQALRSISFLSFDHMELTPCSIACPMADA